MTLIPALLGPIGGIIKSGVGLVTGGVASLTLNAVGGFVLAGAAAALRATAHVIGQATTPQLAAAWFTTSYWRVAGLAALLTVPFLFAAAIQAVVRADLGLLGHSVLVDLPIAGLMVTIAAPLTALLLAATDQMCVMVSGGAIDNGARFLVQAASVAAAGSAIDGSMFFAMFIGLLTLAAAIGLLVEMLIRDAAVYVVVMMLPLAFAALVWPARRIWAVRLVELLLALIFSKFVIVSVLTLASEALGHADGQVSVLLPAMALIVLSTFAPWALMRILPFAEIAAGAASGLRSGIPSVLPLARELNDRFGGPVPRMPIPLGDEPARSEDTADPGWRSAASAPAPRTAPGPLDQQQPGTAADAGVPVTPASAPPSDRPSASSEPSSARPDAVPAEFEPAVSGPHIPLHRVEGGWRLGTPPAEEPQ